MGNPAPVTSVISIHALREEGDLERSVLIMALTLFLSTPSVRRATVLRTAALLHCYISIHALREEGDDIYTIANALVKISIHALREEGDRCRPRF